ncbi:NAD(P)-dependent oxidoreductase [Streptomyces sp. CT34]|uniref:NAD(P)-dependent oxidoreductase n=1 Tax=Streptomyces sp. CT34 TaxID=1553907 RepID=UPI000689E22A|nr:NAD(P)-dependent oxidoreductase [Streptomyces sp. CT34]
MNGIRTVAVLGAGIMGRGIIANLQQAGYALRLYNRTRARLDGLATPRDTVCATPAEAAEGADAVLSVVADAAASREVWLGRHGALTTMVDGSVGVEISTLSAEWARQWHEAVTARGAGAAVAPVTGSRPGAEAGTLIVFAGGADIVLDRLEPVFSAIGQKVIRMGGIPEAVGFKLVYNMLCGTILVAAAEALSLAESLGLAPAHVTAILSAHGWGAGVATSKGRNMTEAHFTDVECAVGTLSKDLAYALRARPGGAPPLLVSQRAQQQLNRACDEGMADWDMAAVKAVYRAR